MRLSTRGRYGVRAMLELALSEGQGPVSLSTMARRQQISLDYLEQLLQRLRKAGLVRSVRGARGGFVLTRPPAQINLWEVVSALEDAVAPVFCVDDVVMKKAPSRKKCKKSKHCAVRLLWAEMALLLRAFMEKHTLQSLADRSRTLDRHAAGCERQPAFEI